MPIDVLLGRPWLLQRPILATTVVFFDNLGRLLARANRVNIGLLPNSDIHHLSPGAFDLGAFIFVSMLDLMTLPTTRSAMTIWHRLQVYNAPDVKNHIHRFVAPS
jgi:hypothetical protein